MDELSFLDDIKRSYFAVERKELPEHGIENVRLIRNSDSFMAEPAQQQKDELTLLSQLEEQRNHYVQVQQRLEAERERKCVELKQLKQTLIMLHMLKGRKDNEEEAEEKEVQHYVRLHQTLMQPCKLNGLTNVVLRLPSAVEEQLLPIEKALAVCQVAAGEAQREILILEGDVDCVVDQLTTLRLNLVVLKIWYRKQESQPQKSPA